MYQTEVEATEIVKRVRGSIKDLTMAASLADGSEGVATVHELLNEYVRDDAESHEANDKALIEMLMGPQGGIRKMEL